MVSREFKAWGDVMGYELWEEVATKKPNDVSTTITTKKLKSDCEMLAQLQEWKKEKRKREKELVCECERRANKYLSVSSTWHSYQTVN